MAVLEIAFPLVSLACLVIMRLLIVFRIPPGRKIIGIIPLDYALLATVSSIFILGVVVKPIDLFFRRRTHHPVHEDQAVMVVLILISYFALALSYMFLLGMLVLIAVDKTSHFVLV